MSTVLPSRAPAAGAARPSTSRRSAATSRSSRARSTASRSSISTTRRRRRSRRPSSSAVADMYRRSYANIHRGVHTLSVEATDAYEQAREKVRAFVNAAETARDRLRPRHDRGDQPRRPDLRPAARRRRRRGRHHRARAPLEHRAVAAPLRGEEGAPEGRCRSTGPARSAWRSSSGCSRRERRIVSVAHVSNALGTLVPVRRIVEIAHARGVPVLVDGAQAVPRLAVDVRELGCDFYAFSGAQDVRPDRGRRPLRAGGAARRHAALPGRRRHDQLGHVREDDVERAPLQVRGGHAEHRRRDRPRRRDRLPRDDRDRERHGAREGPARLRDRAR